MMRIAILGFGSVGRGVAAAIAEKDLDFTVTAIADSRSAACDPDGLDPNAVIETKEKTGKVGREGISAMDVIGDGGFDALVEVTPTNALTGQPALGYIEAALAASKHVVTSNKGPIALSYPELAALARQHEVELRYEATVCGAIPIINTLRQGLAGNRIDRLYGILNGTCNYILTRMADEGLSYQQALLEARELGYAEADPTYDVKGIDAAIKLVILANTVFDMGVTLDDVSITGIDAITTDALALADEQDYTIRLIGEIIPSKRSMRVSPRLLPRDHQLVVHNTLNAVTVETDLAGDITMIGKGAGSMETASAILSDLIFIRDYHVKRA